MKYLIFSICILLISCVDEISLKSAEANGAGYSYSYVDVPPGQTVEIAGTTYNVFKAPVYDAGSDTLYHVKTLSTETLASINLSLTGKAEVDIGLVDVTNAESITISGHDALVIKNCGYSISSSGRTSYCYAMIYLEIGNMILELDIADQATSQSISFSDYDYTDEANADVYVPWSPDATIDEFIDYIQIEQIAL